MIRTAWKISLDRRDSRSMQTQLTVQLKRLIQEGELAAGQRLPSTRELANLLSISRNTVVAAYEMLLGQGYLASRLRSGFCVNEDAKAFVPQPVSNIPAPRTDKRMEPPTLPLPFRPTQPDVNLFPLQIWNRHRNRILKSGTPLLHYQSRFTLGLETLRSNVADYLRDSRGVRCEWHEVAITNGSQQALFLLSQLLLKADSSVLMEDPGYPGARRAWDQMGATILSATIDEDGIQLPEVAPPNLSLIYVTPSHQFPTGACMSLARRLALLKMAYQAKAWIIEDDYDAEFRYTSSPRPSLQSLDEQRKVIYIGSFSKTLFPSMRIGFVVLPPELVDRFTELKSIVDDYNPLIDQATLAAFLESGAFYAHLRRCRRHYSERQSFFLEQVKNGGFPLRFPVSGRGMNLAGLLPKGTNDKALSEHLSDAGLDIPPLNRYATKPIEPGLLFGLTAFTTNEIRTGLEAMNRVMDKVNF